MPLSSSRSSRERSTRNRARNRRHVPIARNLRLSLSLSLALSLRMCASVCLNTANSARNRGRPPNKSSLLLARKSLTGLPKDVSPIQTPACYKVRMHAHAHTVNLTDDKNELGLRQDLPQDRCTTRCVLYVFLCRIDYISFSIKTRHY